MLGFIGVDRKTFKKTLSKGRSVGLVPGGISEMFVCSHGNESETLVVRNRKGFVKIALEHGVQIVPCYCFGNSQTFTSGSGYILLIKLGDYVVKFCITGAILRSISRLFKTSLVIFWGRYGLPLPHKIPLLNVIGRFACKILSFINLMN
jgi:2-acylglycerol O-acyltransferase 2